MKLFAIDNGEGKMTHLINFKNCDTRFFFEIIETSMRIKKNPSLNCSILSGKKLYMLFQKTSTRTALSFAMGMTELGGVYFLQNWEDSNFTVGEIRDEVQYIGRNMDIIVARLKLYEDIQAMAQYSTIPVINGCCNKYHPCQAMADILTLKERFGHFNLSLLYIGVKNNVLNSLIESLPQLGVDLYSLTPIVNEPSNDLELYRKAMASNKYHELDPKISPNELRKIVKNIDVLYTDSWVDMEFFNDKAFEKLKEERIKKMIPYQINRELLEGSKAVVMHAMPIHAGYEISRDITEDSIDLIMQQAENRLHTEKAILAYLLKGIDSL